MPCKSGSSHTGSAGRKASSGTQFEDLSIDLEPGCGCCCGEDCQGGCTCHDTNPNTGGRAVATGPRMINNLLASFDHAGINGCGSLAVGSNSYEAARPVALTQANLFQHNSTSPPAMTWLDRLQHSDEQDGGDSHDNEQDMDVDPPSPAEDEDFIPGLETDDALLEASLVVERELVSEHRSSLSDWDHSFHRSSTSASVNLRGVGGNPTLKHSYFKLAPLPLLEGNHSHRAVPARRTCPCAG